MVGTVRCDVTPDARSKLQPRKNHDTGEAYDLAYLTCKMRTTFTSLEVEVFVSETSIGRVVILISDEELGGSGQAQEAHRASISSPDSYM